MTRLLFLVTLAGFCNGADLTIGSAAPDLTLRQLLQAPSGTDVSWAALKGNAVVLEFWATWCGGCREQIPHLNRLEEQFRGKRVRFLSLTDEEPGIVQRFLRDYPIFGWIGLDSDERTFERYGVNGRPVTVLVDEDGVIRGIGNPADLTEEIINSLLSGKPFVFSRAGTPAPKLQASPEPFFEAMIRPAGPVDVTGFSPGAISGKAGRRWETWGVWLLRLLSEAYGVPEDRIAAPTWAKMNRYDIALAAPDLSEARRLTLLRRTLEDTFQVKTHRELRDTEVFVLRKLTGSEPTLRPGSAGGSSRWGKNGEVAAVSMPVGAIVRVARQTLGKPVVDETGIAGRFDFELKWDASNPLSLIEAVRGQLRLDLSASRRPLEYLVVDSAVELRSW